MSNIDIVVSDYREYIIGEKNLSMNTSENYCRQIKFFLKFLEEQQVPISSFSSEDIHEYIIRLQNNKKLAPRSQAFVISAIKSFVKYQQIEKIRKDNPISDIEQPKINPKLPKVLAEKMVQDLLETPDEDDIKELCEKTMIVMLYATGLRSFELIALSSLNINFEQKLVRIIGKGEKERVVPIADFALDLLIKYLNKLKELNIKPVDEHIFFDPIKLKPYSRQKLYEAIKKYAIRAGFSNIPSAHTFRHAFATHLLNHGADLHTVQLLLGHSSLNTTQIYTHVATKRLHDIYSALNPRA